MSNNKQSSVDFFAEKTFNLIELMKSRYVNQEEFLDGMLKAREQAKEMHKEEHRKTYYEGVRSDFQDFYGYYIKTFGDNHEQQ